MDSSYIDPSGHDLRLPRSRPSSQETFKESSLQSINTNTPSQDTLTLTRPLRPDLTGHDLSQLPSHPTNPPSHPFERPWIYQPPTSLQLEELPLVQVAPSTPNDQPLSFPPDNMSALGIQNYDARLGVGLRPTYTWPAFDMNQQYSPQPMASYTPYTDSSAVSTYGRSASYSPPRSALTAEQRELKRQQDLARRSSKSRVRRERSASGSVTTSTATTPDLLPRTMPVYTQPMGSRSLNAEDNTSLSTPNYIAPYHTHIAGNGSPEMFGTPFSMAQEQFSTLNEYPMYPQTTSDPSMAMYSPRQLPIPSSTDHFAAPALGSPGSQDGVRVVGQRPKPQCWEHGCNGRQFSTFSNLLRHQREKSGVASKSVCPKCGAEFTRTTARNGHMAHDKCKTRRNS